ncbi:MarR family winged helix-turn-helix transcriptional regulator [Paeniglutamicibacter kerguelensis]|uniref:DNA-binding MarR family transcriptional regulator n=1 Tax=Paeniglutamicibacter kerguelensis TaxID=254788 RepID=A0ABS4XHE8_9MICC|nr:MarR family transcriptional regulator [Paeniglutamicibacter kerguelensis]MBP2387872.1 DNA-binding MarR family transcriptional regulator [Paeniglutamicibacter kerguelensis]
MTSESTPDPVFVREFLEALHPLLRRMRAERSLSPGKVGILHHLSQHGRATSKELAAAIRVSPQAISLATPELEELGFIERVPDSDDRRKTWIVLAEAGRAKLEEEIRAGEGWIGQAITEQLTSDERRILLAAIPVLKKIGVEAPRA